MTEKERTERCLRFEETDIVPWQIDYTSEIAKKIMHDLGIREQTHMVRGRNIFAFNGLNDYLGNHLAYLRTEPVNSLSLVQDDVWLDEWGVMWDRHIDKDIGTPVRTILDDSGLENLKIPDPDDPARFEHFEPLIEANGNRFVIAKISRCLFERAWSLRGMENLMVDFIVNPDFVHGLLDTLTGFVLKCIDNLSGFCIDGLRFSDDWGGQNGLLMSPDMWRKFLKPRLKKMYDRAHARGYRVFIHSCGDITAVLDDLVEIGVDVFNPFQPEVMDIESVIERYAGRLGFYGGVSIQRTLPFGSEEDVRREIDHRLGLAHRFGGYIIAPCHDMPPDIPVSNVLAMLKALGKN